MSKKLSVSIIVFIATYVLIIFLMPRFARDGFTKAELLCVGIIFLINVISSIAFLRNLRAILLEMRALRPNLMRPDIRKKLPQSRR